MQRGWRTKPCHASDLKAIGLGMRESACMSEGKWRLRCLLLLWRTWARVWPKRLPNVGSLFHAVPRGDLFLPKVLAQPKTLLRPRITPELSRTDLWPRRCDNLPNNSAATKRSRLERIVRSAGDQVPAAPCLRTFPLWRSLRSLEGSHTPEGHCHCPGADVCGYACVALLETRPHRWNAKG